MEKVYTYVPDTVIMEMGARATLSGLVSRPDLNGREVDVLETADNERVVVKYYDEHKIDTGGGSETIKVKISNLELLHGQRWHLALVACDDDELKTLPNSWPHLRSLKLAGCSSITNDGLAAFACGPVIESDEVRSGARSRGIYATLGAALGGDKPGCRALTSLDLRGCVQIGDNGLLALAEHCPNLATLSLCGCRDVSDRGCLSISRNETVTDINLSGCVKLSDSAISTLARQCPLVALRLANGLRAVTPFAVRAIAEVRGATLTLLDLSGNDHLDVDECLTALSHRCPVLTRLKVDRLTERGEKLVFGWCCSAESGEGWCCSAESAADGVRGHGGNRVW